MKNIYGKNIFITGASSGVGEACAEAFAKSGCSVIGASRRIRDTVHYDNGGSIEYCHMDVTSDEDVKKIISDLKHIDIAILCAGMGVAGPVEELSINMAKKQMDVNYFGTLRVCQAVLTKMREQKKGLIIVISSVAGKVPIPMQSHYSSSKYAIEAMVEAIRMELHRFGIQAALIEPGDTSTGFTDSRIFYSKPDSVYNRIAKASVEKMEKDERNGRSPFSVAKAALKIAGRKHPPVRTVVGFEYKLLMFLLRFFPDRAVEAILRRMYLPR